MYVCIYIYLYIYILYIYIYLKGLYFHQEITKTEAQEVIPRKVLKNMIKTKKAFSQKVGQLPKNLKLL